VVGGGPAGSTCAAFCAESGLKTLLLEKAIFPREKVCGDCLNPGCRPILDRLGLTEGVLTLPHSKLAEVEFIGLRGQSAKFALNANEHGEIAVKRSQFDHLLLQHAGECGAEIRQNAAVTSIERGWRIRVGDECISAKKVVAADGRNSTVARLLGLLPSSKKDRVALQTHLPLPRDFGNRVVLRFLPDGYCGMSSVGNDQLNLCLVGKPHHIDALKKWAEAQFAIAPDHSWRTITPLARRAIAPAHENLFFIGDAARVVEPFTGEGIYYALASGELAARHLIAHSPPADYAREHALLYRDRLWVNEIAKRAVMQPRLGSLTLDLLRLNPAVLRFLTGKIVGNALR